MMVFDQRFAEVFFLTKSMVQSSHYYAGLFNCVIADLCTFQAFAFVIVESRPFSLQLLRSHGVHRTRYSANIKKVTRAEG